MWGMSLLLWGMPTWIQVFFSAKIAGNGNTWQGFVKSKVQNMLSVMGLILLTTITILHSVAKLTINSTLPDWKPRRANHAHISVLLFLLPPSCMIAPIEETVNKFNFPTSFSSTIHSNNQWTLLPSVNTFSNTEMDHSTGTNPVIINDARGRSPCIHKNQLRDSSMSSTVSSTIYH